jgi:chemotaxis-related protein WspD
MREQDAMVSARINDCWNRIGVRGDGSCPELARYVHCRNCPVYAQAAIARLNVDAPNDYLEGWTQHIAQVRADVERETTSCLAFRIGAEWLALPVARVKEVAAARLTHPVPHRRNGAVLGVTNVRGELLPSVSLEHLFGLEPLGTRLVERRPWTTRLVVVEHEGKRTVFPADEVYGIVRFRASELTEVPATVAKASTRYVRGLLPWKNGSLGIIDDRLLFQSVDRGLASSTAI